MSGTGLSAGKLNPETGNTLSLELTLAPDDPTNPFRHLFHPDHKLPEQSYEISRNITFTFSDDDSDGKSITGIPTLSWGSSEIGGIYREEVNGLHKNTLHNEGTFLLHKVSEVSALTQE